MNKNDFIERIKPYTMTSTLRMSALFDCMESIRTNEIEGDLVECGIWAGGNILGMMDYCEFFGISKTIWGFDTFSGMTEPEDIDISHDGTIGKEEYLKPNMNCYYSLEDVHLVLNQSKFPKTMLKLIKGNVCETLTDTKNLPKKIAFLRLDTDWFKSTKIELEVLYPRLSNNGFLIVDDYGHWKGSKLAVDEYFSEKEFKHEMIDYTGLLHKKTV